MKRWEYREYTVPQTNGLAMNILGEEGWELVAAVAYGNYGETLKFYFKREMPLRKCDLSTREP